MNIKAESEVILKEAQCRIPAYFTNLPWLLDSRTGDELPSNPECVKLMNSAFQSCTRSVSGKYDEQEPNEVIRLVGPKWSYREYVLTVLNDLHMEEFDWLIKTLT